MYRNIYTKIRNLSELRIITQLRYCFQVKPHGGHQILTTKTFDRKYTTLTTYHQNNQHFAKWSVLWIVLTKYDLEVGFRFREKCKSFYCGQLNMANKRYFNTLKILKQHKCSAIYIFLFPIYHFINMINISLHEMGPKLQHYKLFLK